jgi:hypothetical protein
MLWGIGVMTGLLCIIAVLLMPVSVVLFFRHSAATLSQESSWDNSKHRSFLTLLGVGGTVIAFGGFWVDWMLWVGAILIELSCIIYYAGSKRPGKENVARDSATQGNEPS